MTVTLEGCLQRALPSAADPSGFELLEARAKGASGLADVPGNYKVKAPSTMDLSAHVNHKVQITGTLSASPSRTAPDTAGDTTSRDMARQSQSRGVLRAEKVEMIADSCSAPEPGVRDER